MTICSFESNKFVETKITSSPQLKRVITWNLDSDSVHIEGKKREIKALKRAFLRWQLVTNLKFKHVNSGGEITIKFSSTDQYFKTRPNALAYAYVGTTSQEIDLVFNESYIWVLNSEIGMNRYDAEIVAIHEIGHVLGLRHSSDPESPMYSTYKGKRDLTEQDIENVQDIHGERSGFSKLIQWMKGYFERII